MSYRVLIRRRVDAAEQWTGWYPYHRNDRENPGSILFDWLENNFSCDCNRHLEFERGKGTLEDYIEDQPCGETAYEVLRIETDDGRKANCDAGQWEPQTA